MHTDEHTDGGRPEVTATPRERFGAVLAQFLHARRAVEGAIGRLDGEAFDEVCATADAALAALIEAPAGSLADVRAKLAAVIRCEDVNRARGDLAAAIDADVARIVAGVSDARPCIVEPLARQCARLARARRRVDQCEPSGVPVDELPPELSDVGFTALYVRSFMGDRIETVATRGGQLVASSPIGLAFQLLALNSAVSRLVDQAEAAITKAGGAMPHDHYPFRDVEWRMRETLVNLVRAVAPLTDPDFQPLEEFLMPDHRAEIERLESFTEMVASAA